MEPAPDPRAVLRWPPSLDADRSPVAPLLFGLAYAGLAVASYELFGAADIGVTFFPPAGLTFAVLVILPPARWPPFLLAIVVAEIGVDLAYGHGLTTAVSWAAVNSVEPAVGAAVAQRISAPAMGRRFSLGVLAGGVAIGPAIGASIGATAIVLRDEGAWSQALADIWVGDAVGVVVVAPLVLALLRPAVFTSVAVTRADVVASAAIALVATGPSSPSATRRSATPRRWPSPCPRLGTGRASSPLPR